jgi:hypothetical protein
MATGEPCRVPTCQWGSTGTSGGWGLPACVPGPDLRPDGRPGCMYRWMTDEDADVYPMTPYATWARAEMDGINDANR